MIQDFYSYIQEEDDKDVISYSFLTSHGSLYYVYFDPYQYTEHTEKYPNLLNFGYGFGFHRISRQKEWVYDSKIGETISKIVFDFIEEYGNRVVLLYHCDFADKKQKGRDKIFHNWYENSKIKESIIKERIKINQVDNNGKEVDFFLGYLTARKNDKYKEVGNEFSIFAEALASNKP